MNKYKSYEDRLKRYVSTKNYVVIRLDGVQFHKKVTDGVGLSYSKEYTRALDKLIPSLESIFEGLICTYIISDEINLIFSPSSAYVRERKEIQKLSSSIAGVISGTLTLSLGKLISYDARVLNLDKSKLCGYINERKSTGYNTYIQYVLKQHGYMKGNVYSKLSYKEKVLENNGISISRLNQDYTDGKLVLHSNDEYLEERFKLYKSYEDKYKDVDLLL